MICLPIFTQLYVKHITLFFKLHLWGWFSTNNRKQILVFAILSLKITLPHRRERAAGAFKASTWYEQSCFLWINFENWALIGWHYFRTFGPSLIMDFPYNYFVKFHKIIIESFQFLTWLPKKCSIALIVLSLWEIVTKNFSFWKTFSPKF